MESNFSAEYKSILEKIDLIDPVKYGRTRNYIDGHVTNLSPYISRGVISTKQVLKSLIKKGFKALEIEQFIKELCWRDYFQRVAQHKNINQDIKQPQQQILNYEIPQAIINATTEITGIDNSINKLYLTGYMHNHCRMYTASLVCNIAKSHWYNAAQWMYYHLLDGDWASNVCSWQWVAGSNSNKNYYANQENINKFTYTKQSGTFLDKSIEELSNMEVPDALSGTLKFVGETILPATASIKIDTSAPTFIYNYYNLDPLWHYTEHGNRVLLLEPEFFMQYPISKKCVDFMLALSKNIPDIQVYVGSFKSLTNNYGLIDIYYKEHPLNVGYIGVEEPRDWISDQIKEYVPSFFGYWKKVEKHLLK